MVELIVNDGTEFDGDSAREMLELIARLEPQIRGVLVNRKHDYSMSFEAQCLVASYNKGVKAVAILTHSRFAYLAAKFAHSKIFKIGIFLDREDAAKWLLNMINQ